MSTEFLLLEENVLTEEKLIAMYGLSYRPEDEGKVVKYSQISSEKARVQELLDLCINSFVTDVTLDDIIYDFICS